MARIPIGLQLYSVREDCKKDLPAVLAAVAKMGYDGVEFAGYYNCSAKELRKLLDGLKLKCCGTHIGIDTLTGDALKATIAFNLELGNPYLIVPWIEEKYRKTRTLNIDKFKAVFPEVYMTCCDVERRDLEQKMEHLGEKINLTLIDKLIKPVALEAAPGVVLVKETITYGVVRKC